MPLNCHVRAARDFLLQHRTAYEVAAAGFRWPDLPVYNFATEWFDGLAVENPDGIALWVIDGEREKRGRRKRQPGGRTEEPVSPPSAGNLERVDRLAPRKRAQDHEQKEDGVSLDLPARVDAVDDGVPGQLSSRGSERKAPRDHDRGTGSRQRSSEHAGPPRRGRRRARSVFQHLSSRVVSDYSTGVGGVSSAP